MRKSFIWTGLLLGTSLLLGSGGCASLESAKISHENKEEKSAPLKERTARTQYPVPSKGKWKELPFIEENTAPKSTKAEKERGYMISKRPITQIVYPNTKPQWFERINSLSGFAAQDEFEPLTFSIYPKRALKNLRVKVSPLKCGDSVIPAENLTTRLPTYWKLRYPQYTSKGTYRWVPELLERVTVHSSPSEKSQRYWITLKVPENAKPGIYTGKITLTDDGFDKAVVIPVKFRVLGFNLESDPNKHYSVYVYDLHMANLKKPEDIAWLKKAIPNNYKAMKEYGIDTPPTLRLRYNKKTGKAYLTKDGAAIDKLKKAGISGDFIPVASGYIISPLYAKHTGRKPKYYPHWKVPENPPDAFYKELTRVMKEFEKERKKRGWPEFIYCPLDEVSSSAEEFGTKTYKAFKSAGCKTFITKSPTAADANAYAPYVNAFCGQPFAIDYQSVKKSKNEHWSYPNHVSGEIKNPKVMCKGGRMTYGYGFWRSGYTTLIPWIWRWGHNPRFKFNYLKNPTRSQTGVQIDEAGEVIPTPYWECFREGRDDARYIYTLQSAIVERETSKDRKCNELTKEGKELLQKIWNSINVQTKYKSEAMWPDSEFDAIRWEMAVTIEKLLKFPAVKKAKAPSVLANTNEKSKSVDVGDFFKKQKAKGNLEILDLGSESFDRWKSLANEGTTSLSEKMAKNGKRSLEYKVKIDHKGDGGGEVGKYPIGWPRVRIKFPKNSLDMTKYDYMSMWIRVDSDRDEVADDFTFLCYNMGSWNTKGYLFDKQILGNVEQRKWIPVNISIKEMMNQRGLGKSAWESIQFMQIWLGENKYKDGTNLTFNIDDICLISMKKPALKSIDSPRIILLPEKYLVLTPNIMGMAKVENGEHMLNAVILDKAGNKVVTKQKDLAKGGKFILNIKDLKPGKYTLKLSIGEPAISVVSEEFEAIKGPTEL